MSPWSREKEQPAASAAMVAARTRWRTMRLSDFTDSNRRARASYSFALRLTDEIAVTRMRRTRPGFSRRASSAEAEVMDSTLLFCSVNQNTYESLMIQHVMGFQRLT